MSPQLFISAFGLGLLSSFHCVGMCGAIALSLPTQHMAPAKKYIGIVLYNAGRASVYALLGLLFGLLGRQFYIAGWQQWFSIIAGILILILVIQNLFNLRSRLFAFWFGYRLVQKGMSRFLQQKHPGLLFFLGAANGLLPCGMVYMAITGALITGSIYNSVLFMLFFGLGTLPLMLLVSAIGINLNLSVRKAAKNMVPFFMAAMGTLLILRGMGLGIPYISPYLPVAPKEAIVCH